MDEMNVGHRERVRQRIAVQGLVGFQDYEILEYLLFAHIPRKDTKPIAKNLLATCGSLCAVFNSSPQLLQTIPDMTYNASLYLSTLPLVFHRYTMAAYKEKPDLSCHQYIYNYAQNLYQNQKIEQIFLLALDSKGFLQEQIELGEGTIDECKLSIRKLVTICINIQTLNVYILHNHPGGTASPSFADIEFTEWAKSALDIMGINFVDHIIVGENSVFSFRKNNILQPKKSSELLGFETSTNKFDTTCAKVAKHKND